MLMRRLRIPVFAAAASLAALACESSTTPQPVAESAAQPEANQRVSAPPTEPITSPTEPTTSPQLTEPSPAQSEPEKGALGTPEQAPIAPEAPEGPGSGTLGGGTAVGLIPHVPEPELPSRERRRMDIDQLSAAILQVTGGHQWTATNGVSQFETLAQTLGKPNYLDLTQEDLEPSALFQKFLADAARAVCQKTLETDMDVNPTLQKVLMVHAGPEDTDMAKVNKNLQALLLSFHGRDLSVDDPAMASWRWLWTSAEHVAQDPALAWRTVCVGLIVHPDFYTY